jgi:hypothetical protein
LQVSLLCADLDSFGYMSRNGEAGSYGSFHFSFLRNLYTDFHSGYADLHFPQHWIKVSFSYILASIGCCIFSFFLFFVFTYFSFFNYFLFYFIIFTFSYMCTYCLGHLPPPPAFLLPKPPNPSISTFGQHLFGPLILRFHWRENIKDNKKDIVIFASLR